MAKNTGRDRCWKVALSRTHRSGSTVTATDLAEFVGVTERTARDVLKTMVGAGVLEAERRGKTSVYSAHPHAWEEGHTD